MVKMGVVWDRTAEFLTDNLGAVLPIALFAYFVPFSISGSFAPMREGAAFQLALTLQLVGLAFSILSVWGSLALVAMVLEPDAPAGTVATRRLLPTLIVSVAIIVAMMLLFAPLGGLLVASGYDLASLGAAPAAIAPAQAGIIALYALVALPLLLWVSARLILLNPAILAEKRMFDAIPRSWAITRGHALPIVGVTLLYFLVSIVAVLATQTVFGSVFRLVAGPAEGLSLAGVLTSVMVAAVQTGFTVIVPVFTAHLYRALVSQREAAPAA